MPKLLIQGEDYFNPIRLVANEKSQLGRGRPADKRAQACEWLTTYLWQAMSEAGRQLPGRSARSSSRTRCSTG